MVFQDLTGLSGYLNGEWQQSGQRFNTVLPHDNRIQSVSYGNATRQDLEVAIQAAKKAQSTWCRKSVNERAHVLLNIADFIHIHRQKLALSIATEVGKPLTEALQEVSASEEFFRYFSGWANWGQHGSIRKTINGRVLTEKAPHGVVGVITPWNYPISNACQKIAAALITGNSLIWRPSEKSPGSALLLTHAFCESGLPTGTINTLIESGSVVSKALVQSPDISAISFTGSTTVGLEIAGAAARRGAAVQCEMGGKNTVVVLKDAELDLAVEKVTVGAFGFSGQRCTAVSRVLLDRAIADAFCEKLIAATLHLTFSEPTVEGSSLGPVITAEHMNGLISQIKAATTRGAQLITGGQQITASTLVNGNYIEPTVITLQDLQDPLWNEELFGPVLTLFIIDELDEAIEIINSSRYGLASAIFTEDNQSIWQFIDQVETGIIKINQATPGLNPYVPVQGWKDSGFGQGELAEEGIDFFTRKKSSYLSDKNH